MTLVELAYKLRPYIEKAVNIALDDTEAIEAATLFPKWSASGEYVVGDRAQYEGVLYKCLTAHTAQETWTPTAAPSLWAKVLIPDPEAIPAWEQPNSTNPYMKGDKVTHNAKTWVSLVDNNVWEPGAVGTENLWTEAT